MRAWICCLAAFLVGCIATFAFGQTKTFDAYKSDTILPITFPGCEGIQSQGSCVVIDKSLILTAGHVVGGSEAVVKFRNESIRGRVIAIDLYHDRALVRLVKELMVQPRSLRTEALKENETIFAVGYGRGFGYTKGTVGKKELRGRATPGDSGGAILDQDGRVCGVVQGYSDDGTLYGHGIDSLVEWIEKNRGNDPVNLGGKDE